MTSFKTDELDLHFIIYMYLFIIWYKEFLHHNLWGSKWLTDFFVGPQYTLKQLFDCVITYRDNGGSFTELDRNENTLLMLLLSSRFELSLNDERNNLNTLLDMLAANRKIIHRKNSAGLTPIMKAASIKVFQCIKKLLERGAKVNAKNKEGNSPLHFCFSESECSYLRCKTSIYYFKTINYISRYFIQMLLNNIIQRYLNCSS